MLRYNTTKKQLEINDQLVPPGKEEIIWVRIDRSYTQNEQSNFIEKLQTYPLAKEKLEEFSELPMVDVFENESVISIFAIQEDYSFVKVNILVGDHYVITIEDEHSEGLFINLVNRFKEHPEYMSHTGKILYHLIDEISTDYLKVVDRIANEILELEKEVFITPFENKIGKSIYRWKIKLHELRQVVEYQGSVIETIGRADFPFTNKEAGFYFQDLSNRYQRVVSAFDTFKENLSGIFNLQISLKSDHTNAIMKMLTLVSVIFIPMTFLAGVYGMNFEFMPELRWKYGYLYSLILMFGVGLGIAFYFKKEGWWGKQK